MKGWWAAATAVVPLLGSVGCIGLEYKQAEAAYAPTESVIEVVAVLRRHVPDDTYRFPPGEDFSGRNVYRSTLLRLENLEQLHGGALRAGHLDGVVSFAKARSLERLRAYDLAAHHFDDAAVNQTLRESAELGARVNSAIADATRIGLQLQDPMHDGAAYPLEPDLVVDDLDARVAILSHWVRKDLPAPYPSILREEIERADLTRTRYFTDMRRVLENGNLLAIGEWQRLIGRHAASKLHSRHMIEAANLYVTLAREYVLAKPPASLEFDPPLFRELVDGATHLYEAVAHQDGTPEKIEATRRLEAFLAFTLQVDSERFSR